MRRRVAFSRDTLQAHRLPPTEFMALNDRPSLPGLGMLVGLSATALGVGYLRSLLFETKPGDPLTIAVVCAVLVSAGLAACYVPARRATRVDPLVALRNES